MKKWLRYLSLGTVATLGVGIFLTGQAQSNLVDLSFYFTPATPESTDPPADWFVYKIAREKLGINLKVIRAQPGQEGSQKLAALASANDLPDYFSIDDRKLFYDFAEKGLLADVEPIVKAMPNRAKERLNNPKLIQLSKVNGVRYGLVERSLFRNRHGLFVRKDWLDKLGLKAPTNLEDFFQVAKAFTERDPDGNGKNDTYGFGLSGSVSNYAPSSGLGVATSSSGGFEWVFAAYGVGSRWNISKSTVKANVKDPRYFQAVQYVKKLNDAKVLDPDWPTLSGGDFAGRWKQGKYGMFMFDFCAAICYQNYPDFDKNNPKGELIYVNPPKGPTGKSGIGLFAPVGTLFAVSKKAADAGKGKALARFLEWANSEEGYFALGFGQKGININVTAKGDPTYEGIPPEKTYNAKENGPFTQMKWFALNGNTGELALRYPPHKSINGRTIVSLNYYAQSSKMPFVDTTAQLLIPPADNQTDIDRYISEGLTQFVLGQKPLDKKSWNAFVAGLNRVKFADYEAGATKALSAAGFIK